MPTDGGEKRTRSRPDALSRFELGAAESFFYKVPQRRHDNVAQTDVRTYPGEFVLARHG